MLVNAKRLGFGVSGECELYGNIEYGFGGSGRMVYKYTVRNCPAWLLYYSTLEML